MQEQFCTVAMLGEIAMIHGHGMVLLGQASLRVVQQDMFSQWSDSNHRLMGQSNPYFSVLEDIAAATEGEEFRSWCSGCHNPERVLTGLPFNGHTNNMFERGGASLKKELKEDKYNAALDLLRQQRDVVGRYWHDAFIQIDDFTNEGFVASGSWPFQVNLLVGAEQPISSVIPQEGATEWQIQP